MFKPGQIFIIISHRNLSNTTIKLHCYLSNLLFSSIEITLKFFANVLILHSKIQIHLSILEFLRLAALWDVCMITVTRRSSGDKILGKKNRVRPT